ncbi:hypothetical protein JD844_028299 [Phrynosoma platyrhinos]|uniref:Uncharacterized protein n=1 Tax=Phrynosoma platyrhinos TaxID=52577 RepID=A0ABQ7SHQ2_PHRPL|nr:hypothetical protein JD844_028299 [Phrynosoma platyrhinos]
MYECDQKTIDMLVYVTDGILETHLAVWQDDCSSQLSVQLLVLNSTSSVGTTSSFSTFSPESAVPNNTPQPQCVLPHGSPYLSSPQGLSSRFFKDLKERISHSFSPCPASDEDDNLTILSLRLDNFPKMDGFTSRTFRASGESWEDNVVHDTPSAPAPGTPPAVNLLEEDLLCIEPKYIAILEEIKNAVCGLREDFCNAAQELHIISSELTNIVASVQNMNQFIVALQTDKYESVQL